MRYWPGWVVVGLLLTTTWSGGGPVSGSKATRVRVSAGAPGVKMCDEFCQGGQRAAVLVMGDFQPSVRVGVAVFDSDNKLVGEDEGQDIAAVVWYPPRKG